ncbi:unnamed protein product [Closterium sp. NIES-64]|nr:unnamed protein product [Closterium sp. NIES-64]
MHGDSRTGHRCPANSKPSPPSLNGFVATASRSSRAGREWRRAVREARPPDPAAEAADSESLRTAEEIVGSRAPPAIGAAVDAHLLRSFDGLARDLDHAIRTAATPSQQHDAIATCLLIANALCDWPESDEPRPREAFGFRVLRSMPCAAESLLLRGKPWVARVCCDAGEVRGEGRAPHHCLFPHPPTPFPPPLDLPLPPSSLSRSSSPPRSPPGRHVLSDGAQQQQQAAGSSDPVEGLLRPGRAARTSPATATTPAALSPLLPAGLRAPFLTQLEVASSQVDRTAKRQRSQGGMLARQHSQEDVEQRPPTASATRSPLYSSPPPPPTPHLPPLPPPPSPLSPLPLPLPPLPAPTAASPTPTVNAWELYSHVKAYLARRAGGNGSGDGSAEGSAEGSGDGSGEGSGEEEAQALWRVVRACGVESVGELSGVVDERGWTAMHVAARNGDSPVPAPVCTPQQRLDPRSQPVPFSCPYLPLLTIHSCRRCCAWACQQECAAHATPPRHCTWRHMAGHVDCMCLLAVTSAHIRADGCGADIRADGCGADIRARTAGGWTPLHNAASQQQWGAVRWLAQQGIEPAEVEAAGGNPNANRLPAHLMAQAVQIVREEYARRLGHAGEGGMGLGRRLAWVRAGADGGARQSAEGDGDGGKRPRKRRWDGGKGGDARAVTAADDPLAPVSGAPMAAREGGGLAAGGADGSRDGADDSGDGADGSSDGADGSSDDADVERIESGSSSGCIAVERWRLHCRKKSEKVERRTKRRAQVRENVAARRGVGMGVAAAPPGAGGAVNSGIISSGGSGGGGVSVEELGAVFGLRAGALVARAALPHILAGEALLSPTSLLVLPWKPRWKP